MNNKINELVNELANKLFSMNENTFINVINYALKEIRSNQLTLLADKYGSDKGFSKHLYTRIYGSKFNKERKNINKLLEIGLLLRPLQKKIGNKNSFFVPSLDMWAEYFFNADIYGFDIADFSLVKGKWKEIIQGDQCKRSDLKKIIEINDNFDIIIDDGLHASYHQQVSFSYLFKYVNNGGFYIIEDLHAIPPEEKNNPITRTVFLLEKLALEHQWCSSVASDEEKKYIEKNVSKVEFYDSMSWGCKGAKALAIIHKKK